MRIRTGSAYFRLSLVLLSITLAVIASELAARYLLFSAADREAGAAVLWPKPPELFIRQQRPDARGRLRLRCPETDLLTPHPFLSVTRVLTGPCAEGMMINQAGFYDVNEIPDERDPRYFSILVVGGSVAHGLARMRLKGLNPLEEHLNKNYLSPNGAPFRVLNGAKLGFQQPFQSVVISLYGSSVDGVVALDGYNEAVTIRELPLEGSGAVLDELISRPDQFTPWISQFKVLQAYFQIISPSPFRHSFLAVLLMRKAMATITAGVKRTLGRIGRPRDLFHFSGDPPEKKRLEWNIRRYEQLIRMSKAQAESIGTRYAHFLQPFRWEGKVLTAEEKSYPELVKPDDYRKFIIPLFDKLQREGFPAFSLIQVFKDVREPIYRDHIHYKGDVESSLGNDLVGAAIARGLGQAWHLKRKWSDAR